MCFLLTVEFACYPVLDIHPIKAMIRSRRMRSKRGSCNSSLLHDWIGKLQEFLQLYENRDKQHYFIKEDMLMLFTSFLSSNEGDVYQGSGESLVKSSNMGDEVEDEDSEMKSWLSLFCWHDWRGKREFQCALTDMIHRYRPNSTSLAHCSLDCGSVEAIT